MRPSPSTDQFETRSRKSSVTEPSLSSDRQSTFPTTFFLSRGSDSSKPSTDQQSTDAVSTLQETLDEAGRRSKQTTPRVLDGQQVRPSSRRRSTIKPLSAERTRRRSSTVENEQESARGDLERTTTPSPLPSQNVSLPSSPKSARSARSAQKSDEELTSDDAASQVIASSEEDDEDARPSRIQDSHPELIMPSIKMPSRRPFTGRGKRLGRLKILVAGHKGSGKTSLIKSIVQLCEDIVHVDPLSSTPLTSAPSVQVAQSSRHATQPSYTEIYASTKPYPSWWSDLDESRILRRRKSMGDAVLERNLCFVDTASSTKLEHIIRYTEQQLAVAINCVTNVSHDFASLLSGRGGSQIDVILYLISKDYLAEDLDRIRQLTELTNVVPLIARSDLLSTEEQRVLKQEVDPAFSALPKLPALPSTDTESSIRAVAPYTITSINGPDLDNMDASLLMSPEYVQPLLPSELGLLIDQLFNTDTVAFLKHTSAKKLLAWHATHPRLEGAPSPSLRHSAQNSTLASPFPTSLGNSAVLVPPGPGSASELSLTTSNSYALAKVADHSQREERLAQVRLSKWASDLQLSLQRERERYERLARNERAVWLIERMGEEVRDGQLVAFDHTNAAIAKRDGSPTQSFKSGPIYQHQMHDPLGLLQWQDSMRTRGWIALQVVGSFGVVGGLAFWLAKTWGFTSTLGDWAQDWSEHLFGMND